MAEALSELSCFTPLIALSNIADLVSTWATFPAQSCQVKDLAIPIETVCWSENTDHLLVILHYLAYLRDH